MQVSIRKVGRFLRHDALKLLGLAKLLGVIAGLALPVYAVGGMLASSQEEIDFFFNPKNAFVFGLTTAAGILLSLACKHLQSKIWISILSDST